MNKQLKEIFDSGFVVDAEGNKHKLHSHTRKDQGLYLQKIIEEIKPRHSLEVGLAYGISTLFICESLKKIGGQKHIVIDPFQHDWHNVGLANIKRAGFNDIVSFYREYSDKVLFELFLKNERVQFAYIDSTKVFDLLLVDVHLINKILDVGGVLVLDDCQFLGIKKLCRFLLVHPSFELYSTHKLIVENRSKRRLSKLIRKIPIKRKIFREDLLKTDTELGINYHCLAFKKVAEDTRNWNWYEPF